MNQKQLQRLARRYANAQFGPVLSQINAEYDRRARAGAQSIDAGTSALASQLAPFAAQTHNAYAGAKAEQSALDQAVLSSLTGAGNAAQADLNKQLGAAGQAAPNVAQFGSGAGAAAFGSGSASLSRLISQGAAAENYAGTLPAIARLGGAQSLHDMRLQLESGRQHDVGDLRSKIPGAVANIEQNLSNQELQAQIANQSGLLDAAKLQETTRYHKATVSVRQRAINEENKRSGMTLRERAAYHDRSLQQQADADAKSQAAARQRLKQQRRSQWYSEQAGNWKRNHPNASGNDLQTYLEGLKKRKKKH